MSTTRSSAPTIPWGDARGKYADELTDAELTYYEKAFRRNLEDRSKAQYADANRRILDALEAEARRRHAEQRGGPSAPARSHAPARPRLVQLVGVERELYALDADGQAWRREVAEWIPLE